MVRTMSPLRSRSGGVRLALEEALAREGAKARERSATAGIAGVRSASVMSGMSSARSSASQPLSTRSASPSRRGRGSLSPRRVGKKRPPFKF
jgi:hypothetical protein